eukprot:CAMPEP_0202421650 /NCGR_PEP_ID=MMETSP1128-20130828/50448_1 /ASSEMBLY_ACC=CAM_ASM_000463 /TAXON_ID=3047 /ORGANISM="Dunaliella tertiolecta, Strain CCMP1320" /LENGTH=676 /DNA_ID=CAMNT_0049029679 /DNA_START=93 /DNA_END=2123 /DNA_ORIENTATION=+
MGHDTPHIKFEQAVLVPAYRLRELELQNALAVRIPARLTNSLIKLLSTSLPVTDLKHLKRVRKAHGANGGDQIEVLLCKTHGSAGGDSSTCNGGNEQGPDRPEAAAPAAGGVAASNTTTVPAKIEPSAATAVGLSSAPYPEPPAEPSRAMGAEAQDTSHGTLHQTGSDPTLASSSRSLPADITAELQRHGLTPYQVTVPKNAPQTRQQWEQWGAQYWPMGWKVPDSKMAAAAERVAATQEEQVYFEAHMAHVLQACSGGSGSIPPCNAARIVEPHTGLVVGQGVDCRHSHPLQHATMVAIADAAAWDREQWPAVPSSSATTDLGGEEERRRAAISGGQGALHQQQCCNGSAVANTHQAQQQQQQQQWQCSNGNVPAVGRQQCCSSSRTVAQAVETEQECFDSKATTEWQQQQQQQRGNQDLSDMLPSPSTHAQQQQQQHLQQHQQHPQQQQCTSRDARTEHQASPPADPETCPGSCTGSGMRCADEGVVSKRQRTNGSSSQLCCMPPPCLQQHPVHFQQQPAPPQQQSGGVAEQKENTRHPQQQQQQQQQQISSHQPPQTDQVKQKETAAHPPHHLHDQQGSTSQLPQGPQGHTASAAALGLSRPYMCTGYDCFIAREPCAMCAMALVHSRVARVVFCHPDKAGGALGGRLQLMGQRSLNHHYKVYRLGLVPAAQA